VKTCCPQAACPAKAACPEKVLRHVVLFKFKDTATPEQVKTVVEAFEALPRKINVIRAFEWGTDVSPEKHSQGLTHAFLLTFTSAADRDTYLNHPDHKEFGKLVGPVLDKVTVVDYWAPGAKSNRSGGCGKCPMS
jgi:hypothetical protein